VLLETATMPVSCALCTTALLQAHTAAFRVGRLWKRKNSSFLNLRTSSDGVGGISSHVLARLKSQPGHGGDRVEVWGFGELARKAVCSYC
jgi:hypothetical protein